MSHMPDKRPCLCWAQVAKLADEQLHSMGAQRLCSRGLGDEDTGKMAEQFSSWTQSLLDSMKHRSTMSDQSATADTVDSSDGYVRQTCVLMTGTCICIAYQALVCLYNPPSLKNAGPSRTGTFIYNVIT